jgi:hypothetical protein
MTSKNGWENSSSGPDWIDVESLMRAIAGLHSGAVGFSVLPDGPGFGGGLSLCASIIFDRLPGSSLPTDVSVLAKWPSKDVRTFAAAVLRLFYELDYAIGKAYQQESFWK